MDLVQNQWKSAWSDMRRTKKEAWYEEWELPCSDTHNGNLHFPSLLLIYPDAQCQKMALYLISNHEAVLASYDVVDQILENFCSASDYACARYNPEAERSYTFQRILLDCSNDDFNELCEKTVQCILEEYDGKRH